MPMFTMVILVRLCNKQYCFCKPTRIGP